MPAQEIRLRSTGELQWRLRLSGDRLVAISSQGRQHVMTPEDVAAQMTLGWGWGLLRAIRLRPPAKGAGGSRSLPPHREEILGRLTIRDLARLTRWLGPDAQRLLPRHLVQGPHWLLLLVLLLASTVTLALGFPHADLPRRVVGSLCCGAPLVLLLIARLRPLPWAAVLEPSVMAGIFLFVGTEALLEPQMVGSWVLVGLGWGLGMLRVADAAARLWVFRQPKQAPDPRR